jgi:uncharacterized glyoxalase superfamily protein PhnB
MTTEPVHRATLGSALAYKDPRAAIAWLQDALGFEPTMILTDADGNIGHSELALGNSYIMVGGEWAENIKSPANLGEVCTQTIHIQLTEDIDAHCEHARKAGARIVQEPEDQFYGDRTYRLLDPEGHMWTVSQTVRVVPESEWQAASGLKVSTSL